jgi:hypothetical protein
MGIAAANSQVLRFPLCCSLKADMEKLMTHDRVVSLSVALETALSDGRYEVSMTVTSVSDVRSGCS